MTKVFIATPTPRNEVSGMFSDSLESLKVGLVRGGQAYVSYRTAGFDLAEQRDTAAHRFIESDCTHLLFADSDHAFEPDIYREILDLQKEIVGAACTQRQLDLNNALLLAAAGTPPEIALAASYQFNVEPLSDGSLQRHGSNLYKVGSIGMGFTLIARSCIERLLPTVPRYRTFGDLMVHNLFGRMEIENVRKGEDASFCRRFTDLGGEVWAYSTTKIGHIGSMVHRASFSDHIAAHGRRPSAG